MLSKKKSLSAARSIRLTARCQGPKRPFPRATTVSFSLLICLSALSCANDVKKNIKAPIPAIQVFDDSLSLEDVCAKISLEVMSRIENSDTNSVTVFFRTLDSIADNLRRVLGSDSKKLSGKQAVLNVIYDQWKMAFDPRDDALETLLPHLAFKNGKGNCIAVSLMILILAERLNCPIYGVVLPGHFYCRYNDGSEGINIEPNKRGYSHPDDYYRTRYLSKDNSRYNLKNLNKTETIGVFYYTLGTIFLKKNDPGFAAALLLESCRRIPSLVEAKGNYALALALCGKQDAALEVFKELFETNPKLGNLAANYGAVAMDAGRCELAGQIYKKGLVDFPNDPKLLLGLSQAVLACSKTASPRKDGK